MRFIVLVFAGAPDFDELRLSQKTVAGAALRSRANVEGGIVIAIAPLDGPL